jgi:hypothetical protein
LCKKTVLHCIPRVIRLSSLKIVERLSVPVTYFDIRAYIERDLAIGDGGSGDDNVGKVGDNQLVVHLYRCIISLNGTWQINWQGSQTRNRARYST